MQRGLLDILDVASNWPQGSRSLDFRAKFGPFPNAKKYVFSQFQTKNSQFDKKKFFFFFGSPSLFHIIQIQNIFTISQNNRIQSHLLRSLPFLIVHYGKFNYWNQSSNGNVTHKDDVKFPNFSRNIANFPHSMCPCPIPKKWCESPGPDLVNLRIAWLSELNRLPTEQSRR